uniref:Putative pleckstrin similarity domain protein n=1 Tax=Phlebotomus kandelakii TaxID=1109342 RepID=A0A6B2EHW4_9DIPT
MTSSVASILDDTTPSDSGVQLLDSECSELNESIMSSSGFDFDGASTEGKIATQAISEESHVKEEEKAVPGMTKSDIENSNLPADAVGEAQQIPDEMVSSTCSTFDTEAIVYRRRVKKGKSGGQSVPKKRVSFHEDILKNTKTDNIHIEHGFITYKGAAAKKTPHITRYSWCSEGVGGDGDDMNENSQYVYRNACSDVLDYGKTDIYENPAGNYIPYDNSGIFEYGPQRDRGDFYRCQCSDSNSSLESNEADDQNSNQRRNYKQAKSSSCDCIGGQNNNGPVITENCYFSEPSMDTMQEGPQPKSVWNKERKPKSSCLKKTTKHTDIIQEYDLNGKVKKYNIHQLQEVNNFIDSKTIFGSLKNIFSIPLPERGVPEGSEDLQSVCECIPEGDSRTQSPVRPRPFLSKSLDQGLTKKPPASKKFIHNVDEQLRRKNDADLYAPSVESRKNSTDILSSEISQITDTSQSTQSQYRNKFIINCESTVFEHTGVSYEAQDEKMLPQVKDVEAETTSFLAVPFTRKLTNIFRGFKESPPKPDSTKSLSEEAKFTLLGATAEEKTPNKPPLPADAGKKGRETKNPNRNVMECSITSNSSDRNSTISDITSLTSSTAPTSERQLDGFAKIFGDGSPQHSRHLASPVRKKSLTTRPTERPKMSPDLFNSGRESKNSLLSEEFDDILTITTDASDKNDSDMVIVDYPDVTIPDRPELSDFFKPATSKTSLINRFLRHVTQKKILDATIKRNQFFLSKMSAEKKVCGNLYVKGVKPRNQDLIEDLNAEIALEIEMSGYRQGRRERCELSRLHMDVGVGEVSVEIFNGNCLHILRNESELLLKVFKLYTGYSRDGHMTPVLVFLTDKTLYVTDLVRNRLCNKFVLPYSELDVILMGPYGNTVLLCNGARDMQQVLLAGGPYPADGLVSSLEICARRGGSILPAVGQLTLDHLAPLQAFVRDNSSIPKGDAWQYYAVVNIPAVGMSLEKEPLGPNVKGPLMHRNLGSNGVIQPWYASYFLLKAGVLYMFSDAALKIPSWAIALTECQGARRAVNTTRPHCFELMLRTGTLQLAAPDEYVASEWLQALVQSASGLFEMQERHATLGCTLIMTSNHLITMREDFAAPLRRVNVCPKSPSKENLDPNGRTLSPYESSSEFSSTLSTPTKGDRRSNSTLSTPVRNVGKPSGQLLSPQRGDEKSYSSMSSFYGKNSGVEILTCAAIDEMVALKIPLAPNNWWCVLEFSCQEVRENSDDLVVFFATNSEMRRFLSMLEKMWQVKKDEKFPVTLISDEDAIGEHCTKLFAEINKSWEPLLSAALGYPQ